MDILRTEAELEFLSFIPLKERVALQRYWYRDTKQPDHLLKRLNLLEFIYETPI